MRILGEKKPYIGCVRKYLVMNKLIKQLKLHSSDWPFQIIPFAIHFVECEGKFKLSELRLYVIRVSCGKSE